MHVKAKFPRQVATTTEIEGKSRLRAMLFFILFMFSAAPIMTVASFAETTIATREQFPVMITNSSTPLRPSSLYTPPLQDARIRKELEYLGFDLQVQRTISNSNLAEMLSDQNKTIVLFASQLEQPFATGLFTSDYGAFIPSPDGFRPATILASSGAVIAGVEVEAQPGIVSISDGQTTILASSVPVTQIEQFKSYNIQFSDGFLANAFKYSGAPIEAPTLLAEGETPSDAIQAGNGVLFLASLLDTPAIQNILNLPNVSLYAVTNFGVTQVVKPVVSAAFNVAEEAGEESTEKMNLEGRDLNAPLTPLQNDGSPRFARGETDEALPAWDGEPFDLSKSGHMIAIINRRENDIPQRWSNENFDVFLAYFGDNYNPIHDELSQRSAAAEDALRSGDNQAYLELQREIHELGSIYEVALHSGDFSQMVQAKRAMGPVASNDAEAVVAYFNNSPIGSAPQVRNRPSPRRYDPAYPQITSENDVWVFRSESLNRPEASVIRDNADFAFFHLSPDGLQPIVLTSGKGGEENAERKWISHDLLEVHRDLRAQVADGIGLIVVPNSVSMPTSIINPIPNQRISSASMLGDESISVVRIDSSQKRGRELFNLLLASRAGLALRPQWVRHAMFDRVFVEGMQFWDWNGNVVTLPILPFVDRGPQTDPINAEVNEDTEMLCGTHFPMLAFFDEVLKNTTGIVWISENAFVHFNTLQKMGYSNLTPVVLPYSFLNMSDGPILAASAEDLSIISEDNCEDFWLLPLE